ncbi:MAG TPA: CdaR family protein [Vicinamibacterales bacterium]|nr:CdaR family protein [Vicinamibacterales bacterium]
MALPIFRRLGLKLVSVILAALLWLVVSGEQTVERALRIPLEYTNLPRQLELVGDPPTVVDVRVRGSSGTLSRIAQGELVAVLDVRSARAGQRLFHLTSAEVRAPFGVEVVQVTPSNVSMLFEPSESKTVPVVPEIEGQPAPGFVVSSYRSEPPAVVVVGPGSALKNLTQATTEAVPVNGSSSTVTETVTVGVTDPSVRLRDPQTARVTVTIRRGQ